MRREERLLLVGERVPRPHGVAGAEGALGHRVDRRQLGALGQDPALDHARQHPLAVGLVAVVELALVLVDELLRRVVRGVVGARAEPQVPGLVGLGLLGVADEPQRLVGQVLGEVVAVLGQVGLVDVVVVLGEVRIPVVGLAADEAVEAVVALPERPLLLRRALRPGVDRRCCGSCRPRTCCSRPRAARARASRSPAGCGSCSRGSRWTTRRSTRSRWSGGCGR